MISHMILFVEHSLMHDLCCCWCLPLSNETNTNWSNSFYNLLDEKNLLMQDSKKKSWIIMSFICTVFSQPYPFSFFLTNMVSPWYLKGLVKSMTSALSGLMVRVATMRSALPSSSSPTSPSHRSLLWWWVPPLDTTLRCDESGQGMKKNQYRHQNSH